MKADYRKVIKINKNTERSNILREKNNEYVFEVAKEANKPTIKSAVEELFNVKVQDVRTMIMPGKSKRVNREAGKTSTCKKAIVKLKKGEVISMFDNM